MLNAESARARVKYFKQQLKQAKTSLAAAILEEERRAAVEYPPEPVDAAAITFSIMHDKYGIAYKYAAIRVGSRWYTTGSTCPVNGRGWHELVDWYRREHKGPKPLFFTLNSDGRAISA